MSLGSNNAVGNFRRWLWLLPLLLGSSYAAAYQIAECQGLKVYSYECSLAKDQYQRNSYTNRLSLEYWELRAKEQAEQRAREEEQEEREAEARRRSAAAWEAGRAAREAEEERRRQAIYEQQRARTERMRAEMERFVSSHATDLERDRGVVLAKLAALSTPVPAMSRKYMMAAYRSSPAEYMMLRTIGDAINNPYAETQNGDFRVLKLAETSSHSKFMPYRLYSCALMRRAALSIEADAQQSERARDYARRLAQMCIDALPEAYRKSDTLQLLVTSQPRLEMGTRDFWNDTREGLDGGAVRKKLFALTPMENPKDFLPWSFNLSSLPDI